MSFFSQGEQSPEMFADTTQNSSTFTHQDYACASPLTINTSVIHTPSKKRGEHLSFNANSIPFFGPTQQFYRISSLDKDKSYTLKLIPKIDRGFFLADSEWTCYRRNYFQLSLAYSCVDEDGVELGDNPALLETPGGEEVLSGIAVCVAARVSHGDRKIDLVQHTAKRDKGPQILPTPKVLASGGNPNQYPGIGFNSKVVTFERMQFKTATANNGKRRAVQQFYTLILEVFGVKSSDGSLVKLGISESSSLVVRGRSPGHYVDGKLSEGSMDTFSPMSPMYSSPGTPKTVSPPNIFQDSINPVSYADLVYCNGCPNSLEYPRSDMSQVWSTPREEQITGYGMDDSSTYSPYLGFSSVETTSSESHTDFPTPVTPSVDASSLLDQGMLYDWEGQIF